VIREARIVDRINAEQGGGLSPAVPCRFRQRQRRDPSQSHRCGPPTECASKAHKPAGFISARRGNDGLLPVSIETTPGIPSFSTLHGDQSMKSLAQLRAGDCRFIEGEPDAEDGALFCAEPAIDGRSYCAEHLSICYTQTNKRALSLARAIDRRALRTGSSEMPAFRAAPDIAAPIAFSF
jgi:hypothetical protein